MTRFSIFVNDIFCQRCWTLARRANDGKKDNPTPDCWLSLPSREFTHNQHQSFSPIISYILETTGDGKYWSCSCWVPSHGICSILGDGVLQDMTLKNGDYLVPKRFGFYGPPVVTPPSDLSEDVDIAKQLWTLSEEITGQKFDIGA